MIDTDFYDALVALTTLPVCQGFIPQAALQPRIYFERTATTNDYLLSGAHSLVTVDYDVEVIALDIDVMANQAEAIQTLFDGQFFKMGSTQVLASYVQDQADSYEYKGLNADEAVNTSALKITFVV